ncbi:MAG: hypothetical protein ABIN37_19140, partial [Burkholderiaceae bacterium]
MIAASGIHHFTSSFTCQGTRYSTHDGACSHADRPGDCAYRRTRSCPSAGTYTFGEIVFGQTIVHFWIDDFSGSFAGQASRGRANRRTGNSTDWAGNGTD